jgi:hypothetical protein
MQARADADGALTQRIDNLTTSTDTASASLTAEIKARTTADTALSQSLNTLTTTVNGHTTSIQQNINSVNGLGAEYTVKIDNNGWVSGFGLASYHDPRQGIVNEFVINADRFSVWSLNSNPTGLRPFTIGQVDGQTRTVIADAIIGDAAIRNAKIGNLQVNTAKIAGNSVVVPLFNQGNGGADNMPNGAMSGDLDTVWGSFQDTAAVMVMVCWQAIASFDSSNTWVQLCVDGNVFYETANSVLKDFQGSFVTCARVYVGAGNHSFSFRAGNNWPNGVTTLRAHSITVFGIMR